MPTHKFTAKICCIIIAVTSLFTVPFGGSESSGIQQAAAVMEYENKLFAASAVHNIDIIMDNWDEFIANGKSEEYYICTVVIDNETYKNVAIRCKGNTSLTQVEAYGNDRYSFKIEFDHYDNTKTYHGLDKLCLNNMIQDNTYMKDYLTYRMMAEMGVASPLCSYTYITVNDEDWGLYLAVEGVEEAFLRRNYGNHYGRLYKPDSMDMGGGPGNGRKFDMDAFFTEREPQDMRPDDGMGNKSRHGDETDRGDEPRHENMQDKIPAGRPDGAKPFLPDSERTDSKRMQGSWNQSDDVLLRYIDDEIESYPNIFQNAKTYVSARDQTRLIQALKNLRNGKLDDAVDTGAVIRYFVVHNFVLNFDSYTGSMIHNYYLYEQGGQMQMIPWDYNLAFGGFPSVRSASEAVNYPIDSPVSGGGAEDRPMIAWIFESGEYTELYHQYFSELIAEYFDSGYFADQIDNTVSMISPYVEKDPRKFCTYEEFETGAATLREFCLLRAQSVNGQLAGTIASTSDAQDIGTWIDTGDLQISAMGSMDNRYAK